MAFMLQIGKFGGKSFIISSTIWFPYLQFNLLTLLNKSLLLQKNSKTSHSSSLTLPWQSKLNSHFKAHMKFQFLPSSFPNLFAMGTPSVSTSVLFCLCLFMPGQQLSWMNPACLKLKNRQAYLKDCLVMLELKFIKLNSILSKKTNYYF